MADSTVQVFILSKKQHDILTVDDMIKQQVEENIKILNENSETVKLSKLADSKNATDAANEEKKDPSSNKINSAGNKKRIKNEKTELKKEEQIE